MNILFILALFFSLVAQAQAPNFDPQTNILKIPDLQVGSDTAYSNVQLLLPPGRNWSLFSIGPTRNARAADTVTAPTATEFTLQPAELTGTSADQQLNFVAVGGTPPYQVVSTNTRVFSIAALEQSTSPPRVIGVLQLTRQTGTASAVVMDSAGGILLLPVTISAAQNTVVSKPEFAIQPTELAATTADQQLGFIAVGGTPPYQAVSTNPGIFSIASLDQTISPPQVRGVLQLTHQAGTASVVVSDADGGILQLPVTVTTKQNTIVSEQLFSASPENITSLPGTQLRFALGGGSAPYSVSCANPSLVAIRSLTHFQGIAGAEVIADIVGSSGSAVISFVDSAGAIATSNITVNAPNPGPVSTVPLAASPSRISASYGNQVTLQVSGGAMPYNIRSSNTSVITKLSQNDSTLTANSIVKLYITGRSGSAEIVIVDARGNLLSVPVTATE